MCTPNASCMHIQPHKMKIYMSNLNRPQWIPCYCLEENNRYKWQELNFPLTFLTQNKVLLNRATSFSICTKVSLTTEPGLLDRHRMKTGTTGWNRDGPVMVVLEKIRSTRLEQVSNGTRCKVPKLVFFLIILLKTIN